jgi:uncharacterized membrane protein
MFHFSHPILLLGVIPAWYLYRRFCSTNGLRGVIRYALLALVVGMTAGPVGPASQVGTTLVLVIDQSLSMPSSMMAHKSRLLAEANAQSRPSDRLGVIRFGAIPLVEQYPDPGRPPQTSLGMKINAEQSNMHAAIAAAMELIPERSHGRILVVSDGQSDDELSDELLAQLRRRGVAVHFELFPPDDQQGTGDLVVESVVAPSELDEGDELQLQFQIASEFPASRSLHIRRDDEEVLTLPLQLVAGTNIGNWSERCDRGGVFRYSLMLIDPSDPVPGNNVWEFWVRVRGPRTVLVLNADGLDTPVVEVLRSHGVPIDVMAAAKAKGSLEKLSGYSACVLENVGLGDLAAPPQALAAFVERLGGGLIVTGGDRSFGTGGYRSSVLEPILPVALRPLNVSERQAQALVILADPSAWDAQNQAGPASKFAASGEELSPIQQALLSLSAEMDPADRIGIVATRLPDPVVLPLTVSGKRDVRETIAQLGFSSDRSSFPHALNSAWDMLVNASQSAKHLLILVDGEQLNSWPPPQLDPVVRRSTSNLTVTLVVWGSIDSTAQVHWRSRLPGGRVFSTSNIEELKNLLRQDWELSTGGSFVARPTVAQSVAKLLPDQNEGNAESLPVVDGFHTATLRERATGVLNIRDIPTQPLIAQWDRGLGRVVAVLFHVDSLIGETAEEEHLATLLVQQVKWAGRTSESDSVHPVTELAGRTATVRLAASDLESGQTTSGPAELHLTLGDGTPAGSKPLTPDGATNTSRVQLEEPQSYLGVIQVGKNLVARCPPVMLPRSAEFMREGHADGRSMLTRLARESGGSEWRPGAPLFEESAESFHSLVPFLACLALALLVIDVAERRYQVVGRTEMLLRGRFRSRRREEIPETEPATGIADPFELAKERMRRRVQR